MHLATAKVARCIYRLCIKSGHQASLSQPRLTSNCQLPPLHSQQSCINHLIVNHNRPKSTLDISFLILLDNMFCPGDLLSSGRVRLVNDVNLRWMNGPFPIKTHTRTHLRVPATGLIVTNCQCHPVNNRDTSRTSSSDAFSLGIVVIKELLAAQLLSAYVAREINQAKD